MQKSQSERRSYQPGLVNHAPNGRSGGLAIGLGAALLLIVAGVELLPSEPSQALVLGTAVLLAAIGVGALFALALGLVSFRSGLKGDIFSRALADGAADGILVADRSGRVLYANRTYADLTGALKARDVQPIERVFARIGEGDAEIYRLNQIAAEGGTGCCEVLVRHHPALTDEGGAPRCYRIECRPLELMPDDPERTGDLPVDELVAWSVRDVSDERWLREREFDELRSAVELVDSVPAGFASLDGDGRITFMNAHLAASLGLDLTEAATTALKFEDLRVPGARARDTRADGSLVEDVELRHADGSTLKARTYARSGSSGATGTGSTHMLVTERPDGVADAPDGAAHLFAASPMAIAAIDPDGRIVQSNAAFARAFGVDDVVPENLSELAGDAEHEAVLEACEAARDGAQQRPLEIVTVGDEIIRIHVVAPNGREGNVLLYALEVTEQRALERQMADTQKNQAIGVIAGGVAHDFNNVLTAIVGFADLLLAKYRPSDRAFHDVTQIRNTAFKGASLVRQLLAYTGRQTLRPKTLSMPDVFTDLSMILRRLTGERIKVEVKHGRDLWPVRADVGALERVFVNLCVNARDAINDRIEADVEAGRKPNEGIVRIRTSNVPAGTVRETVGSAEVVEADMLMIELSDTGTGMSKEVMAKVFDPFFTTKKAGKGTGLGLSSVVGIVEQSGGTIHMNSELGEGTTFRILLPRHEASEEELVQPVAGPKQPARDLAGTATILFVEDEDSVRAFGTRTLKERGYTVHEAENGEDALELIEELGGKIDLIVSDVVMPEMDGPTLFRHVREIAPELPFIFASGYAEEAFQKSLPDATEARFGFIPKPYTLKDLAILVKDTLEAREEAA